MGVSQYCTTGLHGGVGFGCTAGDVLDGISLGSFSQSGTGCAPNSYADYTSTPIVLVRSQNYYAFTATTTYPSNENFGVWVDWNDDQDFDDAGEFVMTSVAAHGATTPYNDSILIDNTRPLGIHRMRVRMGWGTTNPFSATNSCGMVTYGETYDYAVDIRPDIVGGCSNQFTNFVIDSIIDVSAKVSWTPGTGNSSWYLEYGVTGFIPGTGTKLTGTYPANQPPVVLTSLTANTSYEVYFGEICNSGSDTAYFGSAQIFQTAVSCPAPVGFAASATGPTSGTASWNSLLGTSYTVILGTSGFNPATGGSSINTANTTTSLGTLTANTGYDVYVIANCGAGGLSDTAGPVSFRTPCTIFTSPYSESFDDTASWTSGTGAQNSNAAIDPCWSRTPDIAVPSVFQFGPRNTSPGSGNGPNQDLTGGNFMYGEASYGVSGQLASITSPAIDVSNLTTPGLYFFQHRYSAGGAIADMYVQVSNDFGSSWDTVYNVSGEIQTSAADAWSLEFVNLVAYTGDTIMMRFVQKSNGCCGDAAIDSVVIDEAPTCPWPTSPSVVSVSDSSAVISWTDPTATNWDVIWGPPGFTQASPGSGSHSALTNPDTIYNLQSNTNYEYYVRANCGPNGASIWIGPVGFKTECAPFMAPYTTNFDSDATGVPAQCWSSYRTGSSVSFSQANVVNSTTNSFSTPQAIYLYNYTPTSIGDTTMALTPRFGDLSAGDKQVRFKAFTTATGVELIVGTRSSSEVGSGFRVIDTLMMTNSYQEFIVPMTTANGYNGTDEYVGLMHGKNGTFQAIYIDDFNYEVIPSCTPPLSLSLSAAKVSAYSELLYWAAGGGDSTIVEVGPTGFTPGTSTQNFVGGTSDTFLLATGLSPQSDYCYYVKDTCFGVGASAWVGPYCFSTPCLSQSMPYYESFDSWKPTCWDTVGGDRFWAPFAGTAGDNYAEANFWGWSTGKAVLTSPLVSITQDAQVRFDWSHLYSASYPDDELVVRAQVAGTNVWDTILSLKGATDFNDATAGNSNTPGNFITEEVLLDPNIYTGNDVVVELWAISDFGPDLFINDFHIENAPTCPKLLNVVASDVTDSSVVMDWTMAPSAATYQVWFGPQGFFQGTQTVGGTRVITTGDSLFVDTLTDRKCYEFLVRSICTPGDTSDWEGPVSFCTPCAPLVAPYLENFDALNTNLAGDFGNCWSGSGTTTSYSWRTNSGATGSGSTGPNGDATTGSGIYLYTEASSGGIGDVATLTSPTVDISALTNPELRFAYHMYGANIDTLYVDIHDGNQWNLGVFQLNEQQQSSSAAPWLDTVISLAPYSSSNYVRARFRLRSRGCCPGDAAIDDVQFGEPITCAQPTVLTVANIGTASADLSWTSNGTSGTNFEISYGLGITSAAAGTKMVVTTGPSATVTGLTPASNYCYYVREICGTADTSYWSGPMCFTTNCTSFNTPYFESYDVWPLACWSHAGGNVAWAQNGTYAEANFWGWGNSDSAIMTSPIVNISGDSRIRYKWSHLYSATYPNDRMDVRVRIVGQPGYTTLLTKMGPSFNDPTAGNTTAGSFIEDTLNLDPAIYNGQSIQVQLVAISDYGPDLFINDFYIEESVVSCPAPTNVAANVIACDSIEVTWNMSNDSTIVLYGPTGSTPTMGGWVLNDSTYYITGTSPNMQLDAYVANVCDGDTSVIAGPVTFNTGTVGAPVATINYTGGLGGLTYGFDGNASTGSGNTYNWTFSTGDSATGPVVSYTFASGGTYTITLVVSNACGSDTATLTLNDVSIAESVLSRGLRLYPNPVEDVLTIELTLDGTKDINVRLMDMSGKQVISSTTAKQNKEVKTTIDLSDLAKGVYMIEVTDGENTAVRRLVKDQVLGIFPKFYKPLSDGCQGGVF